MKNLLTNTKLQRNILLGLMILLAIFYFRSCSNQKVKEKTYEQNVAALTDTVRSYKTKNGELIFEKNALISDKKHLKDLNEQLAKDVKYLKDNPIVVTRTEIVVKEVPVKIPVYPNGQGNWNADKTQYTQGFTWDKDQQFNANNYRKLGGKFNIIVDTSFILKSSDMEITKSEFGMAITTGLTESKDGMLEIFVKSDYPGFQVTSLDGALINPEKSKVLKRYFKPKRWAIGIYTGYGLYVDPSSMRYGLGINLGIGLQYNILQWNF